MHDLQWAWYFLCIYVSLRQLFSALKEMRRMDLEDKQRMLEAGYVKIGGQWIDKEREANYVKIGGQWVDKEREKNLVRVELWMMRKDLEN